MEIVVSHKVEPAHRLPVGNRGLRSGGRYATDFNEV